jgi:hypothetical protein
MRNTLLAIVVAERQPASLLQLDIIVPVVMSCALLWWVSRGMDWTTRLMVAAVTLVAILCIVLYERSWFF